MKTRLTFIAIVIAIQMSCSGSPVDTVIEYNDPVDSVAWTMETTITRADIIAGEHICVMSPCFYCIGMKSRGERRGGGGPPDSTNTGTYYDIPFPSIIPGFGRVRD